MRLYLVRHARPAVPDGMCYGSTDLPVLGDHQQQVLTRLIAALPAGVPVFSSPLQRCRVLATTLAHELDAGQPILDARLVEMNFGTWEMHAWNTIPREEVDAWAADLTAFRPGGGESLLDVARRVRSFHADLSARVLDEAVIVAHAGTIRLLLAVLQSASPEEMVSTAAQTPNNIAYGELTTIDC